MHRFLKFILFSSSTLHVSGGLSVHHQESVYIASGIYQTDCADCLLAGTPASSQPQAIIYFISARLSTLPAYRAK